MYKRTETKQVQVGNVIIGGSDHVVIQSMTTTKTKNVEETCAQIKALATAGCEVVRVAIFDQEDALAIKEIKKDINIPIVADIHFDYRLALLAIESGADKIRINPGNIGSDDRVKAVIDKAKEYNIPIRIGVNGGSLDKEIKDEFGVTARGMFESMKKHVALVESFGFDNIVLSLKSSDIEKAVEAYKMAAEEFPYPLHIGITEAGTKFTGTIKSSVGLGMLLYLGLGNTIRVSLSTDPVEEIKVCKELLSVLDLYEKPKIISCPTCGRLQYDMFPLVKKVEEYLETIKEDITVAVMGCAVNGPGEAQAADIGIAGGRNGGLIFVNGEVKRKVHQDEMFDELVKEIQFFIKQKES